MYSFYLFGILNFLNLSTLEKIGLADAIIIETAFQKELIVVSGYPQIKSLDNIEFLK